MAENTTYTGTQVLLYPSNNFIQVWDYNDVWFGPDQPGSYNVPTVGDFVFRQSDKIFFKVISVTATNSTPPCIPTLETIGVLGTTSFTWNGTTDDVPEGTNPARIYFTNQRALDAVKDYIDNAVLGLWDDRGLFDASINTYPTGTPSGSNKGGSGTNHAVMDGDIWTVNVAGTINGISVPINSTIRSLTDNPGQSDANWAISPPAINLTYTPENVTNKTSNIVDYLTSTTMYWNIKGVVDYITGLLSSYVTNSSLTTTLANYVTNSSLTTTLANYVTNSSLTTTLANYATIALALKTSCSQNTDATVNSGTFNYDCNYGSQKITATGSFTLAFINIPANVTSNYVINAYGWGSYTITLPSHEKVGTTTFTFTSKDEIVCRFNKDGLLRISVAAVN